MQRSSCWTCDSYGYARLVPKRRDPPAVAVAPAPTPTVVAKAAPRPRSTELALLERELANLRADRTLMTEAAVDDRLAQIHARLKAELR